LEKGVPHHFFTEEELLTKFSQFGAMDLHQDWIKVHDKANFVAENAVLESPAQMNLSAEGSTLLFRNFTSIGDIGISVAGATVSIEDSRRPFAQVLSKLVMPTS